MKRTGFTRKAAPSFMDRSRAPLPKRSAKTRQPVKLATGQALPKEPRERFTALETRFNKWMHRECVCCVTGQPVFEIAHTGRKGMAYKSRLKTCLPLILLLHLIEERERPTFWVDVGLPDYTEYAAKLFECFERGECPQMLLQEMNGKVDRDYVRILLGEIDF